VGLLALALVLPAARQRASAGQRPQAPAVVQPNENLVLDGLPPIPQALAERAGPYLEFRTALFLDWEPARRALLIATRFADAPQLHHVAFPGGDRKQLTFYREPVLQALYRPRGKDNAPDGLVFRRDVGGSEFYQLFWRDEKSHAVTTFTDGRSRNTLGPFSNGGRWLAYQSTRRNGKDTDLYVVDPSEPKSDRLLLKVEGNWTALDWSPDDRTLLALEYLSANESRLYQVDAATGQKRLLTPEDKGPVAWSDAHFSRDVRGIYVTTDLDSEFQRLAYMDLKTKKLEVLTAGLPWDVNRIALSRDGSKLAYVADEAGSDTLHLLDLHSRKERPLPKLPLGTIPALKFHANSRDLGFGLSSARSPLDVYSLDTQTGKLKRWTESETGGLDLASFVEPERIRWTSFDGLPITGFLYRPPVRFTGRRPVIINIHGGPEAQYQPQFLGRSNFFLNELGVAVLFPNVRGSSGFGKTFLQLDNGEKREHSVKDIGALLDWIARDSRLDPERVMVVGGSYGGYMAYACMTHYNDRLRAGSSLVGISNFVTFLERTEAYRRDLRRAEYGDESKPEMRALLERISPLTSADKITKPIFIIAGRNDPRVSYQEAEQMVARIKRNHGTVWYLLAKDEGHGFAKKPNQDFLFLATVQFVEENLLK
jgi:dipeptidyl aminopeptidase/acylaminoacyl peptidase